MATRFGASPAQAYHAKMKWLIACLLSLLVAVVVFVVWVVQNPSEDPNMASVPDETPAAEPIAPTVDVLVSTRRLEKGSAISPDMFLVKAWPPDTLPPAYIPAKDKDAIVGKFTTSLVAVNMPLTKDLVSEQQPMNVIDIPPGYRAVTIAINQITGVEGWATPGSRVDVLLTHSAQGSKQQVRTLVRFAKVLSVGGMVNNEQGKAPGGGAGTVSLLVTEKDAKRIELGRTIGALSLTLVGNFENQGTAEGAEEVTAADIFGPGPQQEEKPCEGTMFKKDDAGKLVKYCLKDGKWMQN